MQNKLSNASVIA